MKSFQITAAIDALKAKQKIFHSEADFQFSFAWELQRMLPDAKVRLEYCPPFAREMHIDIYVMDDEGTHPIELKYKSKTIEAVIDNEFFKLKNHSAQDTGRYDFLYDVSRIERMRLLDKDFNNGYAIMLTNDPLYWKSQHRKGTMDEAFRIHEGRVINGALTWADNVCHGTSKGRTEPVIIEGQYLIHWEEYIRIQDDVNGIFQICVVKIN